MKTLIAGLLVATGACALIAAQPPAPAPSPAVSITLNSRQAQVVPSRQGFTHTGGGNIDVAQPAPDTVIITLTGVAVAGPHPFKDSLATLNFQVTQSFDVKFENEKTKKAKLSLEARVIGLLRSHAKGCGTAEICTPASAVVTCNGTQILQIAVPPRGVAGGENLSVNDKQGPVEVAVTQAQFTLHQAFGISASHPRSLKLTKAVSAEFAPDPALDPLWISYWEPFHGAAKKDFGFQLVMKVVPE